MSVTIYQTAERNISEDPILHSANIIPKHTT